MKFRLVEFIEKQYPYYRGVGPKCEFKDSSTELKGLVFITTNRDYADVYAEGGILYGCYLNANKLLSVGNIEGIQGLDSNFNPIGKLVDILKFLSIDIAEFKNNLMLNERDIEYIKSQNYALHSVTASETFNSYITRCGYECIIGQECESESIGIIRDNFNDYIKYEVIKNEN